ncbi:MAG: hypothetical protein QME21_07560 [Anaerolineales bacterium]|nr:hypothetical protein [Anaerolineales bacterium]
MNMHRVNVNLCRTVLIGLCVLVGMSCKILQPSARDTTLATLLPTLSAQTTLSPTRLPGEEIIGEPGKWLRATVTPGFGFNQRLSLSDQIGGNSYAVDVQDGYAYLGVGPRLMILDLSAPSSPKVVGQSEMLPGVVRGVVVQGNIAYVAAGKGGLRVLDVSQPAAPVEIGALTGFQWAMGLVVDQGRAYIADNASGLWIVEVSDPSRPRLLGSYKLKQPASGLAISNGVVYVVQMQGALTAIDARQPENPNLLGEIALPQMSAAVALHGHYAAIAAGMEGLWMVDIADPKAMQKVGALKATWTDGITIEDERAYLTDTMQGLLVVDISQPAQPRLAGAQPLTLFSQQVPGQRQLVARGGRVYLANQNQGLVIVDVASLPAQGALLATAVFSAPSNPQVQTGGISFNAPLSGAAFDVAVQGTMAYVTRDFIGLGVVDASQPSALRYLGSESSFVHGAPVRTSWKLAISGDYAYLADANLGFRVVDVSDLTQPRQIAAIEEPRSVRNVVLQGNLAYITTNEHNPPPGDPKALRSLRVIDVGNPAQPRLIGLLKMEYNSQAIAVQGKYLYYADALEMKEAAEGKRAALHVIDISNPAAPTQVGVLDITQSCPIVFGLAISGNYAFLGDRKNGICVVELSDPTSPQVATVWQEGAQVYDMEMVGDYLFVAAYSHVIALNISDPLHLYVEDATVTPGLAWGLAAVNGRVYVADMDGGLTLLEWR